MCTKNFLNASLFYMDMDMEEFVENHDSVIFLRFYLFIWERERNNKQGEGAEGERERSRLSAEQGARCGAQSQDLEIMTWAKGRCLTNWAIRAPQILWLLLLVSWCFGLLGLLLQITPNWTALNNRNLFFCFNSVLYKDYCMFRRSVPSLSAILQVTSLKKKILFIGALGGSVG